jgi:hypothetical protein
MLGIAFFSYYINQILTSFSNENIYHAALIAAFFVACNSAPAERKTEIATPTTSESDLKNNPTCRRLC